MVEAINKWGEEVRDSILEWWRTCTDKSPVHLVYAFELFQNSNQGVMAQIVDDLIEKNPQMVEKAKKNSKMIGWFTGQALKIDPNLNPAMVTKLLGEKLK